MEKAKISIMMYLLATLLFSAICWYVAIPAYYRGEDSLNTLSLAISVLMWCPALAAVLVSRKYYPKEKILGIQRCEKKYVLAGILLPAMVSIFLCVVFISVYGTNVLPMGRLQELWASPVMILWLLVQCLITALGEEIGWRGFLTPKMAEVFEFKKSALLIGIIWSMWHYPLILAGYLNQAVGELPPMSMQIVLYTLWTTIETFLYTYLRLRSRSIWPAVFLHAVGNFFGSAVLTLFLNKTMHPYLSTASAGPLDLVVWSIVVYVIVRNYQSKIPGEFTQ